MGSHYDDAESSICVALLCLGIATTFFLLVYVVYEWLTKAS